MRQDPSMDEITTEDNLIFLVEEVRHELNQADPNAGIDKEPLLSIVKYIERGKYNPIRTKDEIDLSKAQNLIRKYKSLSEPGCFSCQHRVGFHSAPDEVNDYCGKYEKEQDALKEDFGKSPRIKQYITTGCKERVPIFQPLAEVLKGR